MFVVLKNGLYLDELSFKNIQIKQLYIKWNEKIDISVKKIDIQSTNEKSKNTTPNLKNYIYFLQDIVNSIVIENLSFNKTHISMAYYANSKGFINIKYDDIKILTTFKHKKNELNFHINEMLINHEKVKIKSSIVLNNSGVFYNLKFLNNINSLYILKKFILPKWLKYWVIDAIDMKSLSIKQISGDVEFGNLQKALDNLYILADINKLNYTYNPKLDAVHTTKTELEFKNKVLYIRPKNAYSYGQYLGNSWLKISFNKPPDVMFTLNLLFDGMLNQDVLNILKSYGVDLPFLQHSGKVKTNLTLNINLSHISVDVKGDFSTSKAVFSYLGVKLNIYNTHLILNGLQVKIDKMIADYKDIATASVLVDFNAKNGEGVIDLNLTDVNLLNNNLTLSQKEPLKAKYVIAKTGNYITANSSFWAFKDLLFELPTLKLPFENSIIKIPKTKLLVHKKLSSTLNGFINVSSQKAKIKLHVDNLDYKNIQITKPTNFNITYENNQTTIKHDALDFEIAGVKSYLDNLLVTIKDGVLLLKDTPLKIDTFVKTNFNLTYNIPYGVAMAELKDLNITHVKNIFSFKGSSYFFIQQNKNNTKVYADRIGMKLVATDTKWWADIANIKKLSHYSNDMKKYKVNKGSLHVDKLYKSKFIKFQAIVDYPYKLFVKKNIPISKYKIKGTFDTNQTKLKVKINNKINIDFNDKITVNANGVTLNMYESNRMYKEVIDDDSNSSSKINLSLIAKNSSMFIDENRKIVSNYIALTYKDGVIKSNMNYRNGRAFFRLKKDKFTFYGDKFDDEFMQHLFAFSKFKGGTFGFNVKGNLDEYQGAFFIKKTTIIKYKIINNILAFVNTVPSLITFSLPNYDTQGLPVDLAYSIFTVKNRVFNIQKLSLDSPELKIDGDGKVNINNNTLDLKLTLKTDIGSDLKNVPLVGYIILGNDTISTNLHVYGDLQDPKVETFVVKDILSAPLNILKRTLTLPFYPFMEHNK